MQSIDSQPDGTFQYAVPAGCKYGLGISTSVGRHPIKWVENVSVEAGKTVALGDVKIRRRR